MPKENILVLKKKIVIPQGTELKSWKGVYEAVVGVGKDCVVYLRAYEGSEEEAPDYFKVKDAR